MRIGTLLSALEIRERAMIPALDSLPGEHLPPLEAPVDISRISAGARLTLALPCGLLDLRRFAMCLTETQPPSLCWRISEDVELAGEY